MMNKNKLKGAERSIEQISFKFTSSGPQYNDLRNVVVVEG